MRLQSSWAVRLFALAVLAMPADAAGQSEAKALMDAADVAARPSFNAWKGCLFDFAARVAPSNPEPAAEVVRAARSVCIRYENLIVEAMASVDKRSVWRDFVLMSLWPELEKGVEDRAVAVVMAARTSRR